MAKLVISGVIDGPLSGGVPKAIELTVLQDIADLSIYGIGSANNGGGTDGQEFTFPAVSATAGDVIYVASETIGFTSFFGFAPDYTSAAASINGDDAIELFESGAVIDTFGDIDTDGTGQPWEYLDGWAYRAGGTGPDGATFVQANWTFSGRNALDGESTNASAAAPFPAGSFAGTTGGGDPVDPVDPADPFTDVKIHEIQGTTALTNLSQIGTDDVSPLNGSDVRAQAIVTQLAANGFYMQEEDADADADASTSEGIFVFTGAAPAVTVGDLVTVEGAVSEFFGATQISAASVTVDSSGNPLPTAAIISFPTATVLDTGNGYVANLEAYEGMRVTIPEDMTVTEFFNLDRFGEFKVSSEGRLFQFTQQNAPDAAGFEQHLQDVAARSLTIDDGNSAQNPDDLPVPDLGADGILSAGDVFRIGDSYAGLTGALDYSFGQYRLQAPEGELTANNPRPDTAPADDGFRVASFNVLNFFTTLDEFPSVGEGSGPNGLSPRGADANPQSARPGFDATDEYDRQKAKLVQALAAMDADVVGLVELENDFATGGAAPTGTGTVMGSGVAIQELVDGLNAFLGATIYDWVRPVTGEFVGGDAIATGFIYDMTTTALVGDSAVLDTEAFIDPNDTTADGRNRAAIAQTFEDVATGEQFTAAVNHFKSKGASGLSAGDTTNPDSDQGDGQGFWNDTRTKAAVELANWLATNPTGTSDTDILILGDLNAYAQEDPIQALVSAGYTDLTQAFIGQDAYSFVFDGQAGTLDYAMSSTSLTNKVKSVAEWHINADEPDAFDYNLDFNRDPGLFEGDSAHRNSDHDPVIVTFDFGAAAPQPWTLELLHIADQEGTSTSIVNAPNLSAVMNALEAQDLGNDGVADNTVRLSSGDAIIPGVFYDASIDAFGAGGVADILIQNELGLQAIALGNHEFDKGTAELAGLISGSVAATDQNGDPFTGTAFPYLAANIDFSTDADMAPLEVSGGQAPQARTVTSSTVLDVNGEALGVVGAITPTLPFISSPGSLDVSPSPFGGNPTPAQLDALAAAIQAEVNALLLDTPGLNKIVLLSHMQRIEIEQELAARLTDVDIIVAGGSNTRLFDDNDRPRDGDSDQGQYPIFVENAGGTQTAVVNTDGTYKYVGRLVIDFDENGHIIADSYDAEVSGAYATDQQGLEDLGATGLIDPEIQAIADRIESVIIAKEGNVFGVSDVFLNGNRSGTFATDDPDGVRTQETNLGNLTADANLAIAQAYDATVTVSIKNGGGIRANIGETIVPAGGTAAVRSPNEELRDGEGNLIKPAGGISQNDIAAALAFNNGLTLLTLSFAELKATLENGVDSLPGVSGGFLQVSGVQFSFDETRAPGDRIVNAAIVDADGRDLAVVVRNGVVQTPDQEVRIVTLNFLANGGDQTFDGLANPNRVDLLDLDGDGVADNSLTGAGTFAADGSEQDALAEYLAANFGDSASAFAMADTGPEADTRIQNLAFREDAVIDADRFDFVFSGSNGGNDRFTDTAGNDLILTDGGQRDIFTLSNGGDDVIRIGDHVFDDIRERITVTADQTFVLEVPELVEFEVYQRGGTTYVAFEPDNRFGDLVQIRGGAVTADTLRIETYSALPELDVA